MTMLSAHVKRRETNMLDWITEDNADADIMPIVSIEHS